MGASGLQPELPAALRARVEKPHPPFYLHHPPAWLWRSALALTAGLSSAALGVGLHAWWAGRADVAELALGGFGLVFLWVAARPRAWTQPVSCIADARGVHFFGSDASMAPSFLAWADVGEPFIGRSAAGQGLTRSVVLPVKAGSAFLNPSAQSWIATALSRPTDAAGYRHVPLGNNGLRPAHTLAALQQLRGHSAAHGRQRCMP